MHGLFLVAAAIGAPLYYVMVLGFLVGVAFLSAEHGLEGAWASVVVVLGLLAPLAYGIFPDEELNPCPLHCRWILITGPPGKSWIVFSLRLNNV